VAEDGNDNSNILPNEPIFNCLNKNSQLEAAAPALRDFSFWGSIWWRAWEASPRFAQANSAFGAPILWRAWEANLSLKKG
jgi:hypothetical protein